MPLPPWAVGSARTLVGHGAIRPSSLAVFRWDAWLWMATVLPVSRAQLERPWLAVGLVTMALVVTVADTVLLQTAPCAARARWWPSWPWGHAGAV